MKTKILGALICLFAFAKAYSQQLSGVATYQSQRSIDLKLDEKNENGLNTEMQKQIQEQLKKQFQKEYTLTFEGKESSYQQEESLAPPAPSANGISIKVTGDKGVTYRNLAEDLFIKESEIMGKPFLIKDNPKKPQWILKKEVKNIGTYTCFKAEIIQEYQESSFDEETGARVDSITKTRTTTAWYTLDIPVEHGPDEYWGLPGLILEVTDGEFSLMCTKVVLNPREEVKIVRPKKGKEISQEEYNKIQKAKMEEMIERRGGKRGKNGGVIFTTIQTKG